RDRTVHTLQLRAWTRTGERRHRNGIRAVVRTDQRTRRGRRHALRDPGHRSHGTRPQGVRGAEGRVPRKDERRARTIPLVALRRRAPAEGQDRGSTRRAPPPRGGDLAARSSGPGPARGMESPASPSGTDSPAPPNGQNTLGSTERLTLPA